jgi:hypothetical protein
VAQKHQGADKHSTYDRVILDKSKHEFGYLGARFDSIRRVAFPLADYFPLELGEILKYGCDPEVDSSIGLMYFSSLPLTHVGTMSQIR